MFRPSLGYSFLVAALTSVLFSATAFADDLDADLAQRIERDKKTYQAGVEITRPYPPKNEIKYWETFLEAQPDHVLAPTIRKRVAELNAGLQTTNAAKMAPVTATEKSPEPDTSGSTTPRNLYAGKGATVVDAMTKLDFSHSSVDVAGTASTDSLAFTAVVGHLATDYVALGGLVSVSYASSGNASTTIFELAPAIRFYINQRTRALPYIEFAPGLAVVDASVGTKSASKSGLLLLGGAGLDVLVTQHVALGGSFEYERMFLDPDVNAFGLSLGFGIYF